jgi:hypothetical protein
MRTPRSRRLTEILGLAAAVACPLSAQSGDEAGRAQVLVLGSYHFAEAGQNVAQPEVADVLLPEKQAEIREVVEALARFRPTKIAIERPPESALQVDSLYRAYRSGGHELSRSESQQIGFRLAAKWEHDSVYPIDYRNDFPFPALMEYAQANDPEFVEFVDRELARIEAESSRLQRENTVGEILRWRNHPRQLAEDHATYMRFSAVGAGDTYVGAELLTRWYERNIRIFANLQSLIEPGDRVLVVFGSGHAPILRALVNDHPQMELVDPLEYLPPA